MLPSARVGMPPSQPKTRVGSSRRFWRIRIPTVGRSIRYLVPSSIPTPEIAAVMSRVLGREVRYQYVPIDRFAEIVAASATGAPPRNDAGSMYPEADRLTGKPGREYIMQHLGEVAIDHTNGLFAGTNNFVEEIGGRPPQSVEAFLAKHKHVFD